MVDVMEMKLDNSDNGIPETYTYYDAYGKKHTLTVTPKILKTMQNNGLVNKDGNSIGLCRGTKFNTAYSEMYLRSKIDVFSKALENLSHIDTSLLTTNLFNDQKGSIGDLVKHNDLGFGLIVSIDYSSQWFPTAMIEFEEGSVKPVKISLQKGQTYLKKVNG